MNLFLGSDKMSLACDILANYIRVTKRGLVTVNILTEKTAKLLSIKELPFLINDDTETKLEAPFVVMAELVKAAGFANILLGDNENDKHEVLSFVEMSRKTTPEQLLTHVFKHVEMKMFLVTNHITLADIVVLTHLLTYMKGLDVETLLKHSHAFRWIDHVQHLPGIWEQVVGKGLVVPFPKLQIKQEEAKDVKKKKEKNRGDHYPGKKPEEGKGVEAQKNPDAQKAPEETKIGDQDQKKEVEENKQNKATEEKKEPKKKQPPPPKKGKKEEDNIPALSKLDIRVGRIVKIWPNPDSEKLYNEEIDIGNGEIRTIASGLKLAIPIEKLENALVVVLCNLKPKKLCNYISHGMVLCASNDEHTVIEIVVPPEGSQVGDLVSFPGFERTPVAELNVKKSPFDEVRPDLKTDENLIVNYKGAAMTTVKGNFKSWSLKNANVS